jgi:Phosphotransferase enzyme family
MPDMAQLSPSSSDEMGPAGLSRFLQLVARVEDYDVAGLHQEPGGGWSLALGKARLTWSADGAVVTKTLVPHLVIPHWASLLGTPRRAALNELRVNRMLREHPPPVPVPMLLSSSRRGPSMTFEAVDGAPLGPKFPVSLPGSEVDALIAMAVALRGYRPTRRWFRRLHVGPRLKLHQRSGLIGDADAIALTQLADNPRHKWRFAHGDITARNVLGDSQGRLVLIDWEWAGMYPAGYDLAFLWFSLLDVPGARAKVAGAVPRHEQAGFLLSATLIQLLHLQMWLRRPNPHVAKHKETLQQLLQEVRPTSDVARRGGLAVVGD